MFVETLYAIAIGIGFTHIPENPVKEKPVVLVFLFTLALAGHDWFYHERLEGDTSAYYVFQVLSVLVLSQLFRHSKAGSFRPWLWYFIIFNLLAICWNLAAKIANPLVFSVFNLLLASASILLLTSYERLAKKLDIRYIAVSGFLAVIAIGWWIVPIFNR